ncbi:hypothetical protein HYX19_04025 [Candidatus Woesearchaeota archaeon]|nr:hypothetical protein [Candidatus Woesearchaeota archaeon]
MLYKRGQISYEYVMLVGVILVVMIPLFYVSFSKLSDTVRVNQAEEAVSVLAKTADTVYSLGPGSKSYVWITVPSGAVSTSISNNELLLRLSIFGSISDFHANTKANISGSFPSSQGSYKMSATMLDNGIVVIGLVNDTTPPVISNINPVTGSIVRNSTFTLSANTNKNANCRYSTSSGFSFGSGTLFTTTSGITHSSILTLGNGVYTYYIKCNDTYGNINNNSNQGTTSFTVNLDLTNPVVSNTAVDKNRTIAGNPICVNATATDNQAINTVWVLVTSPLTSPFQQVQNYTMSDTASCAGTSGDNVYGASILMQSPGIWYINTTFANDSADNVGFQSPYPNIKINVSSNSSTGPGQGLTYVIIDKGWYYKTPDNNNLTANDSQSSLSLLTVDLTDDDKNTPPSTNKLKYSNVKNVFEGFIIQLNKTQSDFDYVSIRLKAVDSDILPYNLTIYAYQANNNSLLLTNTTSFQITKVFQAGVDRGSNEVMVTATVKAGSSPFIKLRIVPDTTMNNKVAHISEADFGVA